MKRSGARVKEQEGGCSKDMREEGTESLLRDETPVEAVGKRGKGSRIFQRKARRVDRREGERPQGGRSIARGA